MIEVEPVAGGDIRTAFAFMKAPELAEPTHSGWLAEYQDRRFVPRGARE